MKNKKTIKLELLYAPILFAFPLFVFAAPRTWAELLQLFILILGYALMLLYAIGLLIFMWGIAKFILNTDDAEKREDGKRWMMWGVVAFFVGLVLWGIVSIFTWTFFEADVFIPQLPEI